MMKVSRFTAFPSSAWLLALALGCATAPGSAPVPAAPSEVEAGAYFMRARLLEFNGQLREAAEAYAQASRRDPNSALLERHLADVWVRMGALDRATGHAERALQLDPSDMQVRQGLAAVYASGGRFEDAIELLEVALEEESLEIDGYLALFNLYLQSGEIEEARGVAQVLVERQPDAVRGFLALGAALERLGDADAAERAYRDALRLESAVPGPLYDAIARLYRRGDDRDGEHNIWEEKLVEIPGDPAALHRIAQLREASEDRAGAIEALEELVSWQPDDLNARVQLGFFYYQDERLPEAIAEFEAVVERNPTLDEVFYYLGVVYAAAGEHERALQALGVVPPKASRYPDSRFRMARILDLESRYPDALRQMEEAIAVSDQADSVALQVYHAGLKQRAGDFEGAVALMSSLVEAQPQSADLLYDLGVVYGEEGQEERALELMQEVIELDPDHASGLNYVGYTWADRGVRLGEAEQLVRRAVELRPEDGYIRDSLGWVLYKRGLLELSEGRVRASRESLRESVVELEQAIAQIDPDDPLITRHLADAYRAVFRFSDALVAYRRALELGPKSEDEIDIRRQIELIELQLPSASTGTVH